MLCEGHVCCIVLPLRDQASPLAHGYCSEVLDGYGRGGHSAEGASGGGRARGRANATLGVGPEVGIIVELGLGVLRLGLGLGL